MSHYATLRDYQFDADVDDIRGATLYGEGGQKLGRIEDIVFEHGSGNIEYLVANDGHSRRVLIPVNRVRTSIVSDRDFDSDLTREDMAHLPAFQEDMLKHDKEWKHYMQLHENALRDRDEVARRAYKRDWTDDPVEHQTGDVAHTITPVEVTPDAPVAGEQRHDDYVPDLTPNRLAPIFTNTAQTPDKLNMVPNAGMSRGPAADYQNAGLGVKWNGYQEMVRRDLPKLRGACETCTEDKAA
jgi:sporulation protein YlmC with PRC-barrel domain